MPKLADFLDRVSRRERDGAKWLRQSLSDTQRTSTDLFNAVDAPRYTGQTRANGSHIFIPVVYDHCLAQIQEIADTFDDVSLLAVPDSQEPVDVIGAKLARELFDMHVEAQVKEEGWFPFVWTCAYQGTVESMVQTKWYWSFVTDKNGDVARDTLRFETIPPGDLLWDPMASFTREPTWWLHKIYREESYVKQRISDGVWRGRNADGSVVSFEELKGNATVESSMEREARYYPERDPYADRDGKEGLLELWEYYELSHGEWHKALSVKGALLLESPEVNADGAKYQPFAVGYVIPRAYHFDGESTAFRSLDLQREINVNRNLDIDSRNRELNPRTIVSTRAGLDVQAFRDGSPLITAARNGPDAIREFRFSPSAQATGPRDAISMRDIANITGRTPVAQGAAPGSVRGTYGVERLNENARQPMNRRLKTMWSTVFVPGLEKALYLIRRYETDEARLLKAAKRAGLPGSVTPEQLVEIIDRADIHLQRDPDMRRIDPHGLEADLREIAQMAIQAQRPDIAFKVMAELLQLKGHPEFAEKMLQPVDKAMLPAQQGPGKAQVNPRVMTPAT